MNRMPNLRRWIAGLCLAALLLAAITHAGLGLPVATLAPLLLFVAIIITAPILLTDRRRELCPFPVLPLFAPRPPPIR
jgi:ABC-type transport system involved in cytochrome c biogenesis permease subunit